MFVRSDYGTVFVDLLYAIIVLNFVVIAADIYQVARLRYLKHIYEIKCINQIRYKRMKIDELLMKWNVTLPKEIEINRKLLFVHHITQIEDKIRELDEQEEMAIKQGMKADFLLEHGEEQNREIKVRKEME